MRGRGGGGQFRGGSRGRGGGGQRRENDEVMDLNQGKRGQCAVADEDRSLFQLYQKELDSHYDRFERITKIRRDITIESKRIIFLLHRVTTANGAAERDEILNQACNRLMALREHQFQAIAHELLGIDQNQYAFAVSGGLQEFIEAWSFYSFLRDQRLSTHGDVQVLLAYPKPGDAGGNLNERLFVLVTLSDYVCGIGDLGGELMRFAMNQISAGNLDAPGDVADFMRAMYRGFLLLGNTVPSKEFAMKVRVLRESLMKVESALCMLNVRRSEVPEHLLADFVNMQCRNINLVADGGGGGGGVGMDDEEEFR